MVNSLVGILGSVIGQDGTEWSSEQGKPLPKRVLLAVTCYNGVFYDDGTRTGLFYGEALHPYQEFKKAGFEVDIASETGTYGVDKYTVTPKYLSEKDIEHFFDNNSEFNKKLAELNKASDLDPTRYGIFYASAGYGSHYDYPKAKALQNIASTVWRRGGILAAVCYASAFFLHVLDQSGNSVIKDRNVTGSNSKRQVMSGVQCKKIDNDVTIDIAASITGAIYHSPKLPLEDYTIVDGRLITGANPASARSTAEKAIEAFYQQ